MHLLICTKLTLITKDVMWYAYGFLWTDINGFIVSSVSWHCSLLSCFLSAEAQKRKSKWDSAIPVTLAQPTIITTTATLPSVVSVTTTASGTKTTVISAVGTIQKKAKQWHQTGPESRLVSVKLEDPCHPVASYQCQKKGKDTERGQMNWRTAFQATHKCPPISSWTVIEGFAALFLWDCICTGMPLSQKSLLNSVLCEWKKTSCAQTVHCWNMSIIYFFNMLATVVI